MASLDEKSLVCTFTFHALWSSENCIIFFGLINLITTFVVYDPNYEKLSNGHAPPGTQSSLEIVKGMTIKYHNNSSLCSCQSSGWSGPLINVYCDTCTSCCHLWSSSDVFDLIFCIFLRIYLFWHMYYSPKLFHHLWQLDYFFPDLIFRSSYIHLSLCYVA